MDSVKKIVKNVNWDNDVIRVMDDLKMEGPVQFSYDRTVNSLIEVAVELIKRVDYLTAEVEKLSQKPKASKKKEEVEKPEDA